MLVYIREAHPSEETSGPRNRSQFGGGGPGIVSQPTTIAQRHRAAQKCVSGLGLTLPTVVDDMSNSTNEAYGAHPDRLYVIGKDGKVAFQGEPGPWGFDPTALETALRKTLKGS